MYKMNRLVLFLYGDVLRNVLINFLLDALWSMMRESLCLNDCCNCTSLSSILAKLLLGVKCG